MKPPTDLPHPNWVSIDDVDIATYDLGPQEGDSLGDVVFCHGTPWSSQVWAHAARELSRKYRVHLWDMPGYGRSPKDPAVRIDLDSQMSRFAQLLRHWQLPAPFVIAHDIGGAVALGAHLRHDSDYSALFLWDVVTLDPWGSEFFQLVADHAEIFARLPPPLHEALVSKYIQGATFNELPPQWLTALVRPWLGDIGQPAFYRQIAALRPEHTRPIVERLGRMRCPSAIGWGAQDPWIPVAQAAQLQARLPGTPPLTVLDQAGHLTPVEASSTVVNVLENWLADAGETKSAHGSSPD